DVFVEHVGPPAEHLVDGAVDQLLIAGNGVGRQHHRVAFFNLQPVVVATGQPPHHRRGLALRAGGHDDHSLRRQRGNITDVNEGGLVDFEVAQVHRHFGVVTHGAPGDGQVTAVSLRRVGYQLDA